MRFTVKQTRQLEWWFSRHKYITPAQRKTIARELSLHEKQVRRPLLVTCYLSAES